MIRTVLLATCCCLCAPAAPASARDGDFASGQMLARACGSPSAGQQNLCDGYIAGALDMVASSAEMKAAICVPPNTKLGAMREAVARYAPSHEGDTRGSGLGLLTATVKATYPCPAR